MAAYEIATWQSDEVDSVTDALSAIETQMELLDSTTNTIYDQGILPIGGGKYFVAYIVYKS